MAPHEDMGVCKLKNEENGNLRSNVTENKKKGKRKKKKKNQYRKLKTISNWEEPF